MLSFLSICCKKNLLSFCLLLRWSPWYGTSSQALLWSNMRAMPFVFPQPHGYREMEMSVGTFCGLLLTNGSLPPSFPPCCLCQSSVISTMNRAGSSGHLPTESELNHSPTLSTRGPGLLEMLLWRWWKPSVYQCGDVVTWHAVVAC